MTFHITSRGVRKEPLFHDRLDFVRLLGVIDDAVAVSEWVCLAYCLMTNHFHLVVRLGRASLSSGMHRINSQYARRYNERHGQVGHVFEARFAAAAVIHESHLFEALRYVPLNPVRAGICSDPGEWEWSSFRATAGLARPPAFLAAREARAIFPGSTVSERGAEYARFVRSAVQEPLSIS
jgi:putative transposase